MESGGYEELGIAAALSRPWDYPTACDELSAMLRLGYSYSHLPKRLQLLVFQDTLLALRILPDIQTGYGVKAANSLLQAAEVVLPKQKKAMVVSEYKHSIIAHKRRSKSHHNDRDIVDLPYDILVSVFSHLDMRSRVAASLVCRSWNSAANENTLWKIDYSIFFGSSGVKEIDTQYDFDWKETFQEKYNELAVGSPTNRAVCRNCHSIVWLSTLTSRAPHSCSMFGQKEPKLKLISPKKLPKNVLGEDLWNELGFATGDGDSDEPLWSQYRLPKWACSSFQCDSS